MTLGNIIVKTVLKLLGHITLSIISTSTGTFLDILIPYLDIHISISSYFVFNEQIMQIHEIGQKIMYQNYQEYLDRQDYKLRKDCSIDQILKRPTSHRPRRLSIINWAPYYKFLYGF
jgi:hypothetical protein